MGTLFELTICVVELYSILTISARPTVCFGNVQARLNETLINSPTKATKMRAQSEW